MLRPVFTIFFALAAASAEAQVAADCASLEAKSVMRAPDLVYGEGSVRLWRVVTEDGIRLAVFFAPTNPAGRTFCRVVGLTEVGGFRDLNLEEVASVYDPATGLTLEFEIVIDDTGEPLVDRGILRIVIDRARGRLEAETYGG